jgi:hypothetical protein
VSVQPPAIGGSEAGNHPASYCLTLASAARCESSLDRVFFSVRNVDGRPLLEGFSALFTLSATITGGIEPFCKSGAIERFIPVVLRFAHLPSSHQSTGLQPVIAAIRAGNPLVSCRFQFWNPGREPIKVYRFPIQDGYSLKA